MGVTKTTKDLIGIQLDKDEAFLVAPIANVDKSILDIDLGGIFNIEAWDYKKYLNLHSDILQTQQVNVEGEILHEFYPYSKTYKNNNHKDFSYSDRLKEVYVLTARINISVVEDYTKNVIKQHRECDFYSSIIMKKIEKIRILSSGDIYIPYIFWLVEDEPYFSYTDFPKFHHREGNFNIHKKDIGLFCEYLTLFNRPHHAYLDIAFNNFQASYSVTNYNIDFIILLTVLETLFNHGRSESTQKIARACAVILGKTKPLSRKIFKDIKGLYNKRSRFLHEGDIKCISDDDVMQLKHYVRLCLRHVLALNIDKKDLIKRIDEYGYGESKYFLANGKYEKKIFSLLNQMY